MKPALLPLLLLLLPAANAAAAGERSDRLDKMIAQMREAVELAERKCLVNESQSTQKTVSASLRKLFAGVSGGASVETKSQVLRGAPAGFSQTQQVAETQALHSCLDRIMLPVLAVMDAEAAEAAPANRWPNPIDFRFNFLRQPNSNAKQYSGVVRLDVTANLQHRSRRLVVADPQGMAFYSQDLAFPMPGKDARGTMVAERQGDAYLATTPPLLTSICVRPASKLPKPDSTDYDWFDCKEGGQCTPSRQSTGWLEACPAAGKPQLGWSDWLLPSAHAATVSAPFWLEPSYLALTERPQQGVGYTVFSLNTAAFDQPGITGVEVGVWVNGTEVREDGLLPEQRVLAKQPGQPFIHSFALQTLDFQGAHAGCDQIELRLRPVLANGGAAPVTRTTLSYVALRDVAPRTQPLGNAAQLNWRATYMTPEREWRHIAELNSYIFNTRDTAARQTAVHQVQEDKQWLDQQNYVYDGKKVVGVIRPPRTVQANGSAAFGLGAGLVQPNGQVRFTFSEGDARKLAAFMIGQRGGNSRASRTIHPQPYIFQSASGAYTVAGICE